MHGETLAVSYLLKQDVIGQVPELVITEQEYLDAKRCHQQIYEAFEIELSFDFMVSNYIEIEKYIAEHLVLDMVGQTRSEDAMREQQWGFTRTLNNWLASIGFWHDLTKNRIARISERGPEYQLFIDASKKIKEDEFETAFLFHMRNYSQHGGFPLSSSTMGGRWNKEWSHLTYSAGYMLNYERIRSYFEGSGRGSRLRRKFGNRIKEYSNGEPFDLKPIIRKSLGIFGQFMDEMRSYMEDRFLANETFIIDLIERYTTAYPKASILGLSVIPVDQNKIATNKDEIISIRDEFIIRARKMRKKNNQKTLQSMEKRIISNK